MKTLFLFLPLLITTIAVAEPNLFKVVPGIPTTSVQFKSEATLESVKGLTSTITGYIELDGSTVRSEIHADLATLKTGIALRDHEMCQNHLETAKYPEAVFSLTSLEMPSGGLVEGSRTPVIARGNLVLHGTTREIVPETFLTLENNGHSLRVQSAFTVKLADYNISRPQFLLLRLAEEQNITVDITAVNDSGGETSQKGDK